MATYGYGGVPFGVLPDRGRYPRPVDEAGQPRRLTLTIELATRADMADFVGLWSDVDWETPLGRRTAEYTTQAGHGPDTLVVPSSGLGPGSESTYEDAFLVRVEPEGSVKKAGIYVVRCLFEIR